MMTWHKGQSGNPGGRPKRDKLITQRIIAALTEADGAKLHRLCDALLDKAMSGDVPAIREVFDRVEGKAVQAMEHDATIQYDHEAAGESLDRKLNTLGERLIAENAEPQTPMEHFALAIVRQRQQ
jgi:hypothetical protein